jgi:hypothetical protein
MDDFLLGDRFTATVRRLLVRNPVLVTIHVVWTNLISNGSSRRACQRLEFFPSFAGVCSLAHSPRFPHLSGVFCEACEEGTIQ